MHNLHLIIVKANSPRKACDNVEIYLEDSIHNENNFYFISGCVSEDNEVFINDTFGKFQPTGYTINKINEMVETWIAHPEFEKNVKAQLNKTTDLSKWERNDLRELQQYVRHFYEVSSFNKLKENYVAGHPERTTRFDVLNDSFYSYQFTECGVTEMDDWEGEKTYVVFVDMHN